MNKPCTLQLNNSGAWKSLGSFDAAQEDYADDILTAAAHLVDALNAAHRGRKETTLRVIADDGIGETLMRYVSRDSGWRDRVGNPI